MWWGSDRPRRTRALVLWLVVGLATYAALSHLMPDDDGLGGHVPQIVAVLVYAVGSLFHERSTLRFPSRP